MDITVPQDTSGQVSISDRGTKEAVEIGKLKMILIVLGTLGNVPESWTKT